MSPVSHLLSKCLGVAGAALVTLSLAACKVGPVTIPNPFAGTTVADAAAAAKRDPQVAPPVISTEGMLTIGITPTTAPYTYIDSAGNFSGLDIDFAAALADELGLKARFVQVSGSADAITQGVDVYLSTSAAASPDMLLVGTYAESASGLFRKGSTGVVTAAELSGTTIGVQANSTSSAVLQRAIIDATPREFDSINDAFAALDTGTVNYVLCDADMGAFVARSYDTIGFCGSLGEATPMGVAVAHANTELQAQVQAIVDRFNTGGRTALLRARWLGDLPQVSDATRVVDVQVGTSAAITAPEVTDTSIAAGTNAVTLDGGAESSEE